MKLLLNTLFALIFCLVLALVVLLAVNWQDAPLKPEVNKALGWPVPQEAMHNNGFFVLMGIHSSQDEEAYAVGAKIIEEEIARYAVTRNALDEPAIASQTTPPDLAWAKLKCDYTLQRNCFDFYLQQPVSALSDHLASQQRLMERYDAIKHSQHYVELVMPMASARLPDYNTLLQANELGRVQAALYVQAQQFSEAIALLEDNARFSRRLLNNASTLISYVVALDMIQKEARLVSELLARYPDLARTHATGITSILSPIPIAAYGMKNALAYERALQLGVMRSLKKELAIVRQHSGFSLKSNIAKKLYQPNATANLVYDLASQPMQLVDVSAQALDATAKRLAQQQDALFGLGYAPYYVQNPIGKMLASIGHLNTQHFIERHHDVEGYLTLVRLQMRLAEQAFSIHDINTIRIDYKNPYTQQPMDYDSTNQLIRFVGRQPSSANYHKRADYKIAIGA